MPEAPRPDRKGAASVPSSRDASAPQGTPDAFRTEVERKESRKLRARDAPQHGLGFGLGMFGLVGWSVAVPTLAGIALGVWIDATWPSRFSWTLMLLAAGLAVGCLNAWYWVQREGRDVDE